MVLRMKACPQHSTGKEGVTISLDIDEKELFNKVMAAHNQGVKALIMKNLEANLREKEEGSEYWKLKIFNRFNGI